MIGETEAVKLIVLSLCSRCVIVGMSCVFSQTPVPRIISRPEFFNLEIGVVILENNGALSQPWTTTKAIKSKARGIDVATFNKDCGSSVSHNCQRHACYGMAYFVCAKARQSLRRMQHTKPHPRPHP